MLFTGAELSKLYCCMIRPAIHKRSKKKRRNDKAKEQKNKTKQVPRMKEKCLFSQCSTDRQSKHSKNSQLRPE